MQKKKAISSNVDTKHKLMQSFKVVQQTQLRFFPPLLGEKDEEITGKLKAIEQSVAVYVDSRVENQLSDELADDVAQSFQNISLPRLHRLFGFGIGHR